MPYRSKRQRAWMHVNLPRTARKWDREYGGRIVRRPKSGRPKVRRKVKSE